MTGVNRIKLPMPHPGQRHIHNNRQRFTWLAAGRRWRKTTLFMSICTEAAIRQDQVIWGAPTYDQTYTAWEEMRKASSGVIDFNQSRMTASYGAGRVLFRSLDDPDNARSKTARGIVLDEVGDIAEIAWTEVLRPMLIDTNGWMLAGGTPKGRNWFWREWAAAKNGDRLDSVAFHAPTLGARILPNNGGLERVPHPLENPDIPWHEIVALHQSSSERSFRQEILAEFIEDGGEVFRNPRACATVLAIEPPIANGYYVAGLDWGKLHDATVLTIAEATSRRVVGVWRWQGLDYRFQMTRIAQLCQDYGCVQIVAERNSMGEPLIEQMQYDYSLPVVPFLTTAMSKNEAIDGLALAFEREAIAFPNEAWLIGELEAYERVRTGATGLAVYSAPAGMHDDGVMSLALCWHAVRWVNGGSV